MEVSVRELKANLSRYLHLVKTSGEAVIVTSRDIAMAKLTPIPDSTLPGLQRLAHEGVIRWNGGKPKGGKSRPKISGDSAASRVLRDRG